MHADVFRYVVLVYAFAFVALVTFDTDRRFLKWGYEAEAPAAIPAVAEVPALKHVTPADSQTPAGLPEAAKDI